MDILFNPRYLMKSSSFISANSAHCPMVSFLFAYSFKVVHRFIFNAKSSSCSLKVSKISCGTAILMFTLATRNTSAFFLINIILPWSETKQYFNYILFFRELSLFKLPYRQQNIPKRNRPSWNYSKNKMLSFARMSKLNYKLGKRRPDDC
jgi:hypothetical protein